MDCLVLSCLVLSHLSESNNDTHTTTCFSPYCNSVHDAFLSTMLSDDDRSVSSCSSVGGDSEADLSVVTPMLNEYKTTTPTTTMTVTTTMASQTADNSNDNGDDDDIGHEGTSTTGGRESIEHNDNHDNPNHENNNDDELSYHLPLCDSTSPVPSKTNQSFRYNRQNRMANDHHSKGSPYHDSDSLVNTSIESWSMNDNMTLSDDESHEGMYNNKKDDHDVDSKASDNNKDTTSVEGYGNNRNNNRTNNNHDDDDDEKKKKKDGKDDDQKEEEDGGDNESWWQVILIAIGAGLYSLFMFVKKCCCNNNSDGGDEALDLLEPPK